MNVHKHVRTVLILAVCFITLYALFLHLFKKDLSTIIESPDIAIIKEYIQPEDMHSKTLVIFDIDNTLAEPLDELGSDQWFYAVLNQYISAGYSEDEALELILPVYFKIAETIKLHPVQEITPDIVKKIQTADVTELALTSRSLELVPRTVEQLTQIGIDFSHNPIFGEPELGLSLEEPALYSHGIIFAGNNNKGDLLVHFFDLVDYTPTKVICIDDKISNIHDVQQAIIKRGIQFIGIRYNRLDNKVKSFKLEDTAPALQEFYQMHTDIEPVIAY